MKTMKRVKKNFLNDEPSSSVHQSSTGQKHLDAHAVENHWIEPSSNNGSHGWLENQKSGRKSEKDDGKNLGKAWMALPSRMMISLFNRLNFKSYACWIVSESIRIESKLNKTHSIILIFAAFELSSAHYWTTHRKCFDLVST